MIRVSKICRTDLHRGGGGAIIMNRLHKELRKAGIDSKIFCSEKTTDSPHSIKIPLSARGRFVENQIKKITSRTGLNDIHAIRSFNLMKNDIFRNSDIVHFHGTHSGFFSYLAIPHITSRISAVFTLHDMWCMTGHCAVSYDCQRWKTGCGKCPYPDAHPYVKRDATRIEWLLKKHVYRFSDLTVITLSENQTAQAKQSLLKNFPIIKIPNGIDTEIFRPMDRDRCRSELGIAKDRMVLMMSALRLDQHHKGADLLLKAIDGLPESLRKQTTLLLVGLSGEKISAQTDVETVMTGLIKDDLKKAACYNAADIFVHPTRMDSLPLVVQESMACGTPMVSFNTGGVPDLVRENKTGFLADPENHAELGKCITLLLEDEKKRRAFSENCRKIAVEEYSLQKQVDRHIELYLRLTAKNVNGPGSLKAI